MDMFDEARAMAGTLELCKITQEELGRRLGVGQSCVANKLRLLNFSEEIKSLIRENGLSERHARAILRLRTEGEQREAIDKTVKGKYTVRQCEALVDSMVDKAAPEQIIRADRLSRVDTFRQTLGKSLDTLRSLGVEAREWTSFTSGKMYITICISEA